MTTPSESATTRRAQREVLGLLAAASAVAPPASLHDEVMDRAREARRSGSPTGAPARISPVEAFARTVADLDALLGSLVGPDWGREIAVYGWTVKGLVAHLTAIDRYLAAKLGIVGASPAFSLDPSLEHDHIEMTRAAVDASSQDSAAQVLRSWRAESGRLAAPAVAFTEVDLQNRVGFHGLDIRIGTALLTRVFEIWTHADDIRVAVGRAVEAPAAAVLQEMTRMAVPAIPLGMALRNDSAAAHVARLVLTGPGGGTFDQPLGLGEKPSPTMPGPAVVIVADAVDFCRLAAQRLSIADCAVEFEGDAELGRRVLAGAAVFAA